MKQVYTRKKVSRKFEVTRKKNKVLQTLERVKRSKLNDNERIKGTTENQRVTNLESVKKNEALC